MLTVKEVAARLKCSVSLVYQLMQTGRLKSHVIGLGQGAKRVKEEDLEAFLESCVYQPETNESQTLPLPKKMSS